MSERLRQKVTLSLGEQRCRFRDRRRDGYALFRPRRRGFNNTSQYELFSFNLGLDPHAQNPLSVRDIPGGVYGIVHSAGYVFLATGDATAGFQIWKDDFSKEAYSATLPSKPVSLTCDHDRLYAALSSPAGFAVIVPH